MNRRHHTFVIEAEAEEGVNVAREWAGRELKMQTKGNPDFVVLRYGLLTVGDARKVFEIASGAAFIGENRAIVIAANRAYHEAQNALLKLFEEPPLNTYIFLILPTLGGLLPTLRSRVQILKHQSQNPKSQTNTKHQINLAEEFIKASKEERSVMIKKIAAHQDDGGAVSAREEAISILNGIEEIAYALSAIKHQKLLQDIQVLRAHLYDRSAPVKMILEHISMFIPKNLLQ